MDLVSNAFLFVKISYKNILRKGINVLLIQVRSACYENSLWNFIAVFLLKHEHTNRMQMSTCWASAPKSKRHSQNMERHESFLKRKLQKNNFSLQARSKTICNQSSQYPLQKQFQKVLSLEAVLTFCTRSHFLQILHLFLHFRDLIMAPNSILGRLWSGQIVATSRFRAH